MSDMRINLTYAEAWVLREAMADDIRDYTELPGSRRPPTYEDEPPRQAHLLLARAEEVIGKHRKWYPSKKGLI